MGNRNSLCFRASLTMDFRHILCHLICMSRNKTFYQVALFLFVQIMAFFFFFLRKRAFSFASIIIPTFIPSSEGTQTKYSFLSLTSGNIILIFWESKEPQDRLGHNDLPPFMRG